MRIRRSAVTLAAVLITGCGTAPPSTVPSPSPSGSPSAIDVAPTPVPTLAPVRTAGTTPPMAGSPPPSPPAPATGAWTWTAIDDSQFDWMSLEGVSTLRDGCLVAFSADRPAAMWGSADARTWNRLPDDPAFAPARRARTAAVNDVADTRFGRVAVGSLGNEGNTMTERAVAWLSHDGRTWKRARVAGGADRSMTTIVVTEHGLVALGLAIYDPPWYGSDRDGTAVWTSADGRSWHHVRANDAVPLGTRLFDVARLGDRYYALAFSVGADAMSRSLGLWTSGDAVRWRRARGAPTRLSSIASTGDLLVANGTERTPGRPARPVSWLTTDGRSWTKTRQPQPSSAPAGTRLGGGFLVAGRDAVFSIGGDQDQETLDGFDQVWVLADGEWAAIEPPRTFSENAVAFEGFVAGRGLLLVTDDDPAPPGPATVWLLTPPAIATATDEPRGAGCGGP